MTEFALISSPAGKGLRYSSMLPSTTSDGNVDILHGAAIS